MITGNTRYLTWMIDLLAALVAVFLAVPVTAFVWEPGIAAVVDVTSELLDPAFTIVVLLGNGPAALLGFLAARWTGRGHPATALTASVAAGVTLLIAVGTDLTIVWLLTSLF